MKLRSKAIFAAFASFLLLVGTANSASFDCKKAKTFSEKAICNNPNLSQLDDSLAISYKLALDFAPDADAFKQIARDNLQMRNECKTNACIENWLKRSIRLYDFMAANFPHKSTYDPLAEYPQTVKDACKDPVSDSDMVDCINAQNSYDEKQLEQSYRKAMNSKELPEAEKAELQKFYEQWKLDRPKYCGLEYLGGTIHLVNEAKCSHDWTQTFKDAMEELLNTLDDPNYYSYLRFKLQEAVKNKSNQ